MADVPRICIDFYTPNTNNGPDMTNYPQNFKIPQVILQRVYENRSDRTWRKKTMSIYISPSGSQIKATSIEELEKTGSPLYPLQYTILSDFSSMRDRVQSVLVKILQPIISVKLVFPEFSKDADIRLGFQPGRGTWSMIGTDCFNQHPALDTMNLAWFDVGTVIHEFCHALGMVHSNNSPNGYDIDWNPNAVKNWTNRSFGWSAKETQMEILGRYAKGFMSPNMFEKNSTMRYFYPARFTKNNEVGLMNMKLSDGDLKWLQNKYPNGKNVSDVYDPRDQKIVITQKSDFKYLLIGFALLVFVAISWFLFSRKNTKKIGK
jgi:hypothetical protein